MVDSQLPRESVRQHRRDTRRHIILPAFFALLLIVICLVAVLLLPRRSQVSIVSDTMLTVFVLCPLAICFMPITILFIGAIFGMNRAHDALARPLTRLEDYSKTLTERTGVVTDQVNQQTINLSARLGVLDKLLDVFEMPKEDDE